MSAFLGPIHFWLYNKIRNQEKLTSKIEEFAKQHSYIDENENYSKLLPELESVIDESNIHGWLQAQINDAETRYAELVLKIITPDPSRMSELCELAKNFGKDNAVDKNLDIEDIYRKFEDFFVNGMPCDRVNEVTVNEKDFLTWVQTEDIHAQYWASGNFGTEPYYEIRKYVMLGMLENTGRTLLTNDNESFTIK